MILNKYLPCFLSLLLLIGCGGGGGGNEKKVVPPVPPPVEVSNIAPTADAGQDQSVIEETQVTINGSGTDSDGSIASYSWSQISGGSVTIEGVDRANATFNAPTVFENTGSVSLEFELKVTDNAGAIGVDIVTIEIIPVNKQPTVSVDDNFFIVSGDNNIKLNGAGFDIDGSIVDFFWSQTLGTDVTLNSISPGSGSISSVIFDAPMVDELEQLEFIFEIIDNEGSKNQDLITIDLYPNDSNNSQSTSNSVALTPYYYTDFKFDNPRDIDFYQLTFPHINFDNNITILPIYYSLETIGDVNTECKLYDHNGFVAEDNSSGIGNNCYVEYVLDQGKYYYDKPEDAYDNPQGLFHFLEVKEINSKVSEYEVKAKFSDRPDLIQNSIALKIPVDIGGRTLTFYSSILDNSDKDILSLTFKDTYGSPLITEPFNVIYIVHKANDYDGTLDPYCKLYDENTSLIKENDDDAFYGSSCAVSGTVSINDTLHLEISSFSTASKGQYYVEILFSQDQGLEWDF